MLSRVKMNRQKQGHITQRHVGNSDSVTKIDSAEMFKLWTCCGLVPTNPEQIEATEFEIHGHMPTTTKVSR